MSEDNEKPPLDAALRNLAEQKRRTLTSHPSPQELAAYHAGELPPEAEARILDHLSICPECSDLLLDLSGIADLKPPEGMPELTDEQVEQDWQALRAKMRKEEPERAPAPVVPIRTAGPPPKPDRGYWLPIAASLLAVLGLSFGLYQSTQGGRPWSPEIVPLTNEVQRSAEDAIEHINSGIGAILSLYFDAEAIYPEYEAEIVGQVTVKVTPPKEEGLPVALVIPRGYLKPGVYEIQLYGVNGGQRTPLESYDIQVDEP